MLRVRDLVSSYGKLDVLRGISLDAAEGRITCLLGPNGAGKTTTLFTIAGILSARSGSVLLDGEDLSRLPAPRVVSRGIALVPENRLVFPRMNVEENLRAGAYARRASAVPRSRPTSQTSTGDFRAWRRAGTSSPGLSPEASSRCWRSPGVSWPGPGSCSWTSPRSDWRRLIVDEIFRIIRELNAEGVTILLVEQNAHMALTVAHKFYLIEGGEITFSGSPGELEEDEVIRRAYLGAQKE